MNYYIKEMLKSCLDRYYDPDMYRIKNNIGEDNYNREYGNIIIKPGRQSGKTTAIIEFLRLYKDLYIIVQKESVKKGILNNNNLGPRYNDRIIVVSLNSHSLPDNVVNAQDCIFCVDDYSQYKNPQTIDLIEMLNNKNILIKVG